MTTHLIDLDDPPCTMCPAGKTPMCNVPTVYPINLDWVDCVACRAAWEGRQTTRTRNAHLVADDVALTVRRSMRWFLLKLAFWVALAIIGIRWLL